MIVRSAAGGNAIKEPTSISPDDVSQEMLSRGLPLRVKSRGDSMFPLIHGGDTLLIEPAGADELRPGDIVFFRLPLGSFVVHRLIQRNGSGALLTNGDSLRRYDDPVPAAQVFGRVSKIERGGKALSLTGTFARISGRIITRLARHRVPFQITLKQMLGQLQWLIGRRQL